MADERKRSDFVGDPNTIQIQNFLKDTQ